MIELRIPFTNSGNYIFDPAVVEVQEGKGKLLSRLPISTEIFFAGYNADINGNRGIGSLPGVGTGAPGVSAGRLDLKGPSVKYVDYNVNNLNSLTQTGTIRFRVVLNYNNAPASDRTFFVIVDSASNDNNIKLTHKSDGNINLQLSNSDGSIIIDNDFGIFNAVQGTEIEIELNFNLNDISGGEGLIGLYIDGVLFGDRLRDILTRTTTIDLFRIGSNAAGSDQSDFEISFFQIFDQVIHITDYTPIDQPDTDFSLNIETIQANATALIDQLVSVSVVEIKPGSDDIKYILIRDGISVYHNGAAWVNSDGSFGNSNTIAEINLNVATFTTGLVTIGLIILLKSDDGTTTPEIDEFIIVHNFAGFSGDVISKCIVFGNIINNVSGDNNPVKVFLSRPFSKYKTNTIVRKLDTAQEFTPRENDGFFTIALIENTNMEPGTTWIFEYADGSAESVTVTDIGTCNFGDLVREVKVNI